MAATRSESLPHNRILASVGREELAPLGLIRKGRSRTWLDDCGWWVGVVEFQPSSWSRGSYLNVGATWLWHDEHFLFFDLQSRVQWRDEDGWHEFVRYETDEQFAAETRRLVNRAVESLRKLRGRLGTFEDAARELLRDDDGFWSYFDAGVALGLAGATARAARCFERFAAADAEYDWETEAQQRAAVLADLLDRPARFRAEVEQAIRRFRSALKLDPNVDVFAECRSR